MKSESKEVKARGRWWSGLWSQLLILLSQIFLAFVLAGMVLYLAAQYKMGSFQPFELAVVAGLLGGFPLIAAFGEKVDDGGLRKKLRAIGGFYLLAAICFVVFGFYQAADQAKLFPQTGAGVWMFNVVYVVTFYVGAFALIVGMWMTLEIIPQLMGLGGIRERVKKIFEKSK